MLIFLFEPLLVCFDALLYFLFFHAKYASCNQLILFHFTSRRVSTKEITVINNNNALSAACFNLILCFPQCRMRESNFLFLVNSIFTFWQKHGRRSGGVFFFLQFRILVISISQAVQNKMKIRIAFPDVIAISTNEFIYGALFGHHCPFNHYRFDGS